MNKLGKFAKKLGYAIKRRSPEILTGIGIIGYGVTIVLACKETKKADPIVKEHKSKIEDIKTDYAIGQIEKKEMIVKSAIQTGKTAGKLAVNYAPAIATGLASTACVTGGHHILRKENLKLTTAYVALEKTFSDYRGRTKDRIGEEAEREIRHGIGTLETTTDDGETVKKEKIKFADPKEKKAFVKYLTRSNPCWRNDIEYMKLFVRGQWSIANDMLRARDHLTLNEVYDLFRFEHDEEGFINGWIYDLDYPLGDNRIDIDIEEVSVLNEDGEFETVLSLAFNPDGVIIDKIHPFQRRTKRNIVS